jgi:adenosylcobinamide kinase/adenosylcobinamide-phosphate guanylyltransferase
MPPLTLVTGPSRSGKSEWAERLAARSLRDVVYVATAQVDPEDAEWQARILKHQQRRPPQWRSHHIPWELASFLGTAAATDCLLIDSLGTWVANGLEYPDDRWATDAAAVVDGLQQTAAEVIVVAEEVGWGVVPAYPLGRQFRDRLGRLTRQLGAIADAAYLVTAGYGLPLHHLGQHLDHLDR